MRKQDQLRQGWNHTAQIPMSAVRLVPRWLLLVGILTLALADLSTGHTALAQGGSAQVYYNIMVRQLGGRNRICVGDAEIIRARVQRRNLDKGDNVQGITGAVVTGTVQDPSIGNLSPPQVVTGGGANDPGSADLRFNPKKAGTTTLSFEGKINHIWWGSKIIGGGLVDEKATVSTTLPVTVVNCKYTLSAVARWYIDLGSGNTLELLATIHEAEFNVSAEGHVAGTHSADVVWITNIHHANDCTSDETIAKSTAIISGDVTPDGSIKLNVTSDPSTMKGT